MCRARLKETSLHVFLKFLLFFFFPFLHFFMKLNVTAVLLLICNRWGGGVLGFPLVPSQQQCTSFTEGGLMAP